MAGNSGTTLAPSPTAAPLFIPPSTAGPPSPPAPTPDAREGLDSGTTRRQQGSRTLFLHRATMGQRAGGMVGARGTADAERRGSAKMLSGEEIFPSQIVREDIDEEHVG